MLVLVSYGSYLLETRDFVFNPELILGITFFAYLVDCYFSQIVARNNTAKLIKLSKSTRLGFVDEIVYE